MVPHGWSIGTSDRTPVFKHAAGKAGLGLWGDLDSVFRFLWVPRRILSWQYGCVFFSFVLSPQTWKLIVGKWVNEITYPMKAQSIRLDASARAAKIIEPNAGVKFKLVTSLKPEICPFPFLLRYFFHTYLDSMLVWGQN